MFLAAHRSSSGALNCICSLWFIYPCGDGPLSRLSLDNGPSPHEHINSGITNSIKKLHLVGISAESSYDTRIHDYQTYYFHVPIVLKSGYLIFLEPSGPAQGCFTFY
jgi:hypothetical protein